MLKLKEDFISQEHRQFKWMLGKVLASSLSGFLVGIIVTVIVFISLFNLTWKITEIVAP